MSGCGCGGSSGGVAPDVVEPDVVLDPPCSFQRSCATIDGNCRCSWPDAEPGTRCDCCCCCDCPCECSRPEPDATPLADDLPVLPPDSVGPPEVPPADPALTIGGLAPPQTHDPGSGSGIAGDVAADSRWIPGSSAPPAVTNTWGPSGGASVAPHGPSSPRSPATPSIYVPPELGFSVDGLIAGKSTHGRALTDWGPRLHSPIPCPHDSNAASHTAHTDPPEPIRC